MKDSETGKTVLKTVASFARQNKNTVIRYGLLVLVVAGFAAATGGNIFSSYSISAIISQLTPLIIMCTGMVFVFAHGSIDVAEGAVMAVCALISIQIINVSGGSAGGVLLAMLADIAVCEILYLGMALISLKFRIMSTIASLAVMFTARGLVTYFVSRTANGYKLTDSSALNLFADNRFRIFVAVLVVVVCWILFSYTKLGKYDRAIGDNVLSARQSGANVTRTVTLSYAVAGVCIALAAMFYTARTGSVTENFGQGREMDVMIALILGGMFLSGGSKSRISAAVAGSVTYVILTNGLSQLGLSNSYIMLIKGIVFIVMIGTTLRRQASIKALPR